MAHSINWLPEAIEDVDRIAAYIAIDSPSYASAMVARILGVAHTLREFPERGRIVPEWNADTIREHLIGNYRLIYETQQTQVIILAVIHGARLLPDNVLGRSR